MAKISSMWRISMNGLQNVMIFEFGEGPVVAKVGYSIITDCRLVATGCLPRIKGSVPIATVVKFKKAHGEP